MNKIQINELFYIEKNYSKIKELLKNSSDSWSFNMLAKIALYDKDLTLAYNYFEKSHNLCGCAYCRFLGGNFDEARILLKLVENLSPVSTWLLFLMDLIQGNYSYPSYFQVRDFYEQDLEMLFFYEKYDFIEQIIRNNNYIENFNKEVYKFTARVLINNGDINRAKVFINKSLDICYNDPETHYIIGEIKLLNNDIQGAIRAFKTSIAVNGMYSPASKKIKEIEKS